MFRSWMLPMLRTAWILGAVWCTGTPAWASPWAEVGDRVLRSDVEVLADYGLIAPLLMTWPIPWAQISYQLPIDNDVNLPPHIRRSLERVRARLAEETAIRRIKPGVINRVTNQPALVRDFATTGREEIDTRAEVEYMGTWAAARLSIGYQGEPQFDGGEISLDGSYLALEVENWLLYGGVVDQWWGPGWVSSLILSNNARPFPRVGFMRNNPKAFETPWLSWIGPWQFHAFAGVLDDDGRAVSNPLLFGGRLAINPIEGLELAGTGTLMICGVDQPCNFDVFKDAFFRSEDQEGSDTNSNALAAWDFRYTSSLLKSPFTLYGQMIQEDFASLENGFFGHVSYLLGLSLWGGAGDDGALWRLTSEFSQTRAINNHETLGKNLTYNHGVYRSGYRYDERSLGHSLDNDTALFSLVGTLTDLHDWTYRLAYHHAEINRDGTVNGGRVGRPLSTSNEDINVLEAGLNLPWRNGAFDVELRIQDDQPDSPGEKDFEFAVELGWTIRF